MEIRRYNDEDEASVVTLLKVVFPDYYVHHDPLTVVRRKQAYDKELFFVAIDGAKVTGIVMGGYDGNRGWVFSLAVDPAYRRRGIATALMRHVENSLKELGCPKINLQVQSSNRPVIEFYEKLGYLVEELVSMGKTVSD